MVKPIKKFPRKIFKTKTKIRLLILTLLPLLSGIAVYLVFDNLIMPSVAAAVFMFIILYFWWLLKEVLSATIISVFSFLILVFLFVVLLYFLLKYNGGDIAWNVNIFEIFGLGDYK
jgi:hypothetical protein